MIGSTLSHYRIVAELGTGGMGVVYRAVDTVLERPVALKVMRAELLTLPGLKQRFLQEARAAAALHHPNIATVFEANEAGGVLFIAMEFVEGKTLRARLASPMPLEEGLRAIRGVAAGLCHAHENRVVHRDIKPENILLTPDGQAKILDFGLGKVLEARQAATGETLLAPTQTPIGELTMHGQILGTPAYMSPEQARGLPVDFRSDLFSFGIVAYEVFTSRAPFAGSTAIDTLAQILHVEPQPLTVLDRRLPPE